MKRRLVLSSFRTTKLESGRSPIRSARSAPSAIRFSYRSDIMRSILSSGCRAKNTGSSGTIRRTPYSGGRATRSTPARRSAPRAALSASSIASRASRARSSNASPASVAETCRVVRTRSLTPRRRSSAAIERETEGWESPNSRAVLEKLPLSTVRTNKASCCSRSFMLKANISYLSWRDTYRRGHCLTQPINAFPAPIVARLEG